MNKESHLTLKDEENMDILGLSRYEYSRRKKNSRTLGRVLTAGIAVLAVAAAAKLGLFTEVSDAKADAKRTEEIQEKVQNLENSDMDAGTPGNQLSPKPEDIARVNAEEANTSTTLQAQEPNSK